MTQTKKQNLKNISIGILLDSYNVESWIYQIIKDLKKESFISIDLIIINKSGNEKKIIRKAKHRIGQILSEFRGSYLFENYLKWDHNHHKKNNDAFKYRTSINLTKSIETINVIPKKIKYYDIFENEDLKKIKDKKLDVILRFGFRILKGKILNASKYGIWSFHHDNNTEYRGGPPLFWEIYEGNPKSGTILQVLNEKLDGGRVIYRSISNTKMHSYYLNRNDNYWKTSNFILRRLKHLHLFGWSFIETLETYNENIFYNKKIYKTPTNFQMLYFHWKMLYRDAKSIFLKQFYYEQWEIFLIKNNKKIKISNPNGRWLADPFIVKEEDKVYIFCENFSLKSNKGCISCIELKNDNSFSKPKNIINERFHLSYPNVFKYKNEFYMVPESLENNSVMLYKAVKFPYKWEFQKTLINNIKAVDSTIFFHKDKVWLFTNIAKKGASDWEELYLYYSDSLFGNWTEHPLNPIISDVSTSRPAGNLFINKNGEIIRPSQDCSKTYGYAININKIDVLSTLDYKEKKVKKILPDDFGSFLGTHTFNSIEKIQVYDVKSYKRNKNFKLAKFITSLFGIYHHKPIRLYIKHILKTLLIGKSS